ncbi:alpha/beta hydrolase [Rubellicoccus peritrichatus]|uniref:Alpha/beta hydrolase n=1 Tax=Rubellicoccus peritrichatus TaxID=3080537 RepID=A0AAQ3QVI4_9BACT|nr:alpha/beta hydrolase [Puniceicoccus sp. CR14]WOO40832.1 alpha/beta hydrolase [Puniceicoccus sp. CR14]
MPETTSFTASLKNGTTAPSPTVTPYIPEKPGFGGISLIIFPGGGYGKLADHEGHGLAEFFCAEGIACFVVEYRLGVDGFHHPAMIEDAYAAIATVRASAREFGIDPRRIGVIGSSAGGHLAAHASVAWDTYESDVSLRPDFTILCYPVVYMDGDFCHEGTRTNLLGENPSDEQLSATSVVEHVNDKAPPTFIWHTVGDEAVAVENSIGYATALRVNGVPFEMHIYQRGGHGLSRKTELAWTTDLFRWLREFADGRLMLAK